MLLSGLLGWRFRGSDTKKHPEVGDFRVFKLELLSRFELETSSLPRMRSTN